MELEAAKQFLGLGRSHFGDELVVGLRHFIDGVDRLLVVHLGFALVQHRHTVVLLAQVRQMEIRGERTGEQLRVMQVHRVDGLDSHLQIVAFGVGVGEHTGEALCARIHCVLAHGVEHGEQGFVVFGKHSAQDLQAQLHVVAQRIGEFAFLGVFVPKPDVTTPVSAGVSGCS